MTDRPSLSGSAPQPEADAAPEGRSAVLASDTVSPAEVQETLAPATASRGIRNALAPYIEAEKLERTDPLLTMGAGVRYLMDVGDVHAALRLATEMAPYRAPRLSAARDQLNLFGTDESGRPVAPAIDERGRPMLFFQWHPTDPAPLQQPHTIDAQARTVVETPTSMAPASMTQSAMDDTLKQER